MLGSELALSLLADVVVAATLLGLLVSLQRLSRHPALAGAVTYGIGHVSYSLGSSAYSVMNAGQAAPSQLLAPATAGLAAAIFGTALMVDGAARLLESPHRRAVRSTSITLATLSLITMAVAGRLGADPFKLAADLVDVMAALGLALVVWQPGARPPQRMPSRVAAACLVGIAVLYSDPITFAAGLLPRWLPPYAEWVWLDLALWNTVNFCVLMLASFKALTAFAQRSRIDPLTRLLNRDGLAHECEALQLRHPQGLRVCVLAIDIDHFKRINDAHGHAAGDAYLTGFASTLRDAVRGTDAVARWGGEEFAVVLAGASLDVGGRVAEGVRRAVESATVEVDGVPLRTTASIGIAAGDTLANFDALMAQADRALYAAKHAGRNRVSIAR